MIALVQSLKVFLCTQPTDMRRSFDGLGGLAVNVMKHDPLTGHLFVFRNRSRDCIKILYWDQDGLAIWYKRLEKGTFQFPCDLESSRSQREDSKPASSLEISVSDLSMLLQGIDLTSIQRRKRFEFQPVKQASNSDQKNILK